MLNDDLLVEAETDASLRAVAACLRRALEEIEGALHSDDTPLRKVERTAGALEDLGDSLDRCVDWVPM